MRNFVTLVISVLMLGMASAQSLLVPKLPAKIPFSMTSDLPVVRVTIGERQFELLLDLGGYHAIALSTNALPDVPLTFLKGTDRMRDSNGKVYEARRFVATNVSIEGVPVGDLTGGELLPLIVLPKPLKGLIGWGFLKNYLLVFDFNARELRLYDRADADALRRECGTNEFKIEVENGSVVSDFDTEVGRLKFHWDTGSAGNLLQPGKATDPLLSSSWLRELRVGSKNMPTTRFDQHEFARPKTDAVLGTPFFESHTTCFDFVRRVGAMR